jgi:hypothetical protein
MMDICKCIALISETTNIWFIGQDNNLCSVRIKSEWLNNQPPNIIIPPAKNIETRKGMESAPFSLTDQYIYAEHILIVQQKLPGHIPQVGGVCLRHLGEEMREPGQPTVCVTGAGAGVDSAWEQEKLEARKMLENGDESHLSSARFVSHRYY